MIKDKEGGLSPSEPIENSGEFTTSSFTSAGAAAGLSEEKQIEEIRNIIETDCDFVCEKCEFDEKEHCFIHYCSTAIYNAGYRKQSEGEWKKRGNEKTCSLCKFIYYSNNDEWNYCPNCGAKMKGGEE